MTKAQKAKLKEEQKELLEKAKSYLNSSAYNLSDSDNGKIVLYTLSMLSNGQIAPMGTNIEQMVKGYNSMVKELEQIREFVKGQNDAIARLIVKIDQKSIIT